MVCGEGLVSLLACSGTIACSRAVGSMGMMGNEQGLSPRGWEWGRVPASIPSSLPGSCLPRRPGRWLARQPPVGRWAMRETDGLVARLPLVPPLALSPWVGPAFLLFLLFFGGEEWGDYLSFETYASMTAMATMFTMSLTLESKSVKWIGLFSPICIGPMTSVSGEKALMSL